MRASGPTLALRKAIAFAVHFENVDVMGQAIEQGTGQPFGAKYAGPFVERQVAGHDGGAPFVSLAEDLEQQLGAGLRQWHIAEFVDDEQLVTGELALQAQKPFLVAGLDQLMHEGGGGREAGRQTLLARCQAEPQCDVTLAGSGVADRDDVLSPLDIF